MLQQLETRGQAGNPARDDTGRETLAAHLSAKRHTADGLYLHVPFCFHKCHYCDFYSIVESGPDRQELFTHRLIAELDHRAAQVDITPETIFVGGGTPTLLRVELWRTLLAAMRERGLLDRVQEFTIEANPETVTRELLDVLVAGGVNRISIGAQSFDPGLLKTLERWHDPANVPRAAKLAREAGIHNVNLDLIFSTPGETLDLLHRDLDAALAVGPNHLSCYGLTYEPNTAMTQRLKMGQFKATDEEIERDMFAAVIDRLASAGFEHYEVSNWARIKSGVSGFASRVKSPETRNARHETLSFRCAHNMLYWTNRNWLGVGPAAASHIDGVRWKNEPHLGHYLDATPEPPTIDIEQLPDDRGVGEELMLGLRLLEGVEEAWLDHRVPLKDARRATIAELIKINMLERANGRVRLTRRGLFVADSVIAKLL